MEEYMKKVFLTAVLVVAFLASGASMPVHADTSNYALKGDGQDYTGEATLFCLSYDDVQSVISSFAEAGDDGAFDQAEALIDLPLDTPSDAIATHCRQLSEGVVTTQPSKTLQALLTAVCVPATDENDPSQGCFVTVPALLVINSDAPPVLGYAAITIYPSDPKLSLAGR